MLAKEGVYVYGPGDMSLVEFTDADGDLCEDRAALHISAPLHLFGHGKVTIKPADAPPFTDWGIGPNKIACCIYSTSPRGTLDGLSIEAPCGTIVDHWTYGVGIEYGDLRLQSCTISARKKSGGHAVLVSGPLTEPTIVGCQLLRGRRTVQWQDGALGRLEGCTISGAELFGLALYGYSAPIGTNNFFKNTRAGIYIHHDVDALWTPGTGNRFKNIEVENVYDQRGKREEDLYRED